MVLDKEGGFYDIAKGAKYYERIYHLGIDHNRDIPDSIYQEVLSILAVESIGKKSFDKALFYIDELKRASEIGINIDDNCLFVCDMYALMTTLPQGQYVKALGYLKDFRARVTKKNLPGLENTDIMTAIIYDNVFREYQKQYGDKLIELTFDDKKYVIIFMGKWDIEKPFMGWGCALDDEEDEEEDNETLLYAEDGTVHNDIHGKLMFSFKYTKETNGVVPQEDSNTRMITVTPEQRKKMVEAYRKYMKKAKK